MALSDRLHLARGENGKIVYLEERPLPPRFYGIVEEILAVQGVGTSWANKLLVGMGNELTDPGLDDLGEVVRQWRGEVSPGGLQAPTLQDFLSVGTPQSREATIRIACPLTFGGVKKEENESWTLEYITALGELALGGASDNNLKKSYTLFVLRYVLVHSNMTKLDAILHFIRETYPGHVHNGLKKAHGSKAVNDKFREDACTAIVASLLDANDMNSVVEQFFAERTVDPDLPPIAPYSRATDNFFGDKSVDFRVAYAFFTGLKLPPGLDLSSAAIIGLRPTKKSFNYGLKTSLEGWGISTNNKLKLYGGLCDHPISCTDRARGGFSESMIEVIRPITKTGKSQIFLCRLKEQPQFTFVLKQYTDKIKRIEKYGRVEALLNGYVRLPNIIFLYGYFFRKSASRGRVTICFLQGVGGPNLRATVDRLNEPNAHPGGMEEIRQAVSVAQQILKVLVVFHKWGFQHHDIKPNNIIEAPIKGRVQMLDLGSAKIAIPQDGSNATYQVGTPEYYFPDSVGLPQDVYATGKTAVELCTGQKLPPGHVKKQEIYKMMRPKFNTADVNDATLKVLAKILFYMMRGHVDKRWTSHLDFAIIHWMWIMP
jgi:serine/threonine protein kinase